jgi:sugar phosphate isomerase/epimerase
MKISCHTWAFNDLTLPEALGTIARMGFRYVDIGSGTQFNTQRAASEPKKEAADIRADLESFNLDVSDLYLMLPRISLAEADRRSKDIELYKSLVPFAQALGAPGITLSPGLAHPADDTAAYERTRDALKEMVDWGKEAGLQISIEPHMDSMAQDPKTLQKLLKDVEGLMLTLDWGALVCQNMSHEDIMKLLPKARHIQVHQAARAQLQTPFDRGRIDMAKVVSALNEASYEGFVCIKYMKGSGPHGLLEVNTLRESLQLRDVLRAAKPA